MTTQAPKLQTVLHTYSFDVSTKDGRAAWEAFKAERKSGPPCMGPVLANHWAAFRDLDGKTVTLDPGEGNKNLFDNQWNTTEGRRVFDWTLQSDSAPHAPELSAPRNIRRGHYLEQTPEMRELRRNTNVCGYCGHKEEAQRGAVFCPRCIGSEYLKIDDLHLTRMRAVEEQGPRAKLTEAEKAYLVPLYTQAQVHGNTERDKVRIAKERAALAAEFDKAISTATEKRDGMLWLMDHGMKTENVLYYPHTGRFSFGWRRALSEGEVSAVLEVISEFRWPYEIKTEDGRTLNGNIG
ncbi:hypothetical protein CPT_Sansa112 [Caulobacter phage Sansa]|uniref:Uncharacterized protein n=1 Tax=Caulobacter phage Sansa TaxID=1675600 RepID=A0A0K1LLY7_9CAUD|nr:hypothetical protein HOR07_gp112 [Caulobacter phage Sansa]AKU43516.1 hypothetical protein CPT_Sansa112 [Caulobacter phage Sansa]